MTPREIWGGGDWSGSPPVGIDYPRGLRITTAAPLTDGGSWAAEARRWRPHFGADPEPAARGEGATWQAALTALRAALYAPAPQGDAPGAPLTDSEIENGC